MFNGIPGLAIMGAASGTDVEGLKMLLVVLFSSKWKDTCRQRRPLACCSKVHCSMHGSI